MIKRCLPAGAYKIQVHHPGLRGKFYMRVVDGIFTPALEETGETFLLAYDDNRPGTITLQIGRVFSYYFAHVDGKDLLFNLPVLDGDQSQRANFEVFDISTVGVVLKFIGRRKFALQLRVRGAYVLYDPATRAITLADQIATIFRLTKFIFHPV